MRRVALSLAIVLVFNVGVQIGGIALCSGIVNVPWWQNERD